MFKEEIKKITISTDFITLGQLLKFTGVVLNGGEVKSFIIEHKIEVNGQICTQRGKKLREHDVISIDNSLFFEIVK